MTSDDTTQEQAGTGQARAQPSEVEAERVDAVQGKGQNGGAEMPAQSAREGTGDAEPEVGLGREAYTNILETVEAERMDAYRVLEDHRERVETFNQEANAELNEIQEDLTQARAELRAEERKEPYRSGQDHQTAVSPLKKRVSRLDADLSSAQKKAQSEAQSLNQRTQTLQRAAEQLDQEWRHHQKPAEQLGINLDAYWTPGDPFPEDEEDGGEDGE